MFYVFQSRFFESVPVVFFETGHCRRSGRRRIDRSAAQYRQRRDGRSRTAGSVIASRRFITIFI